MDVIKRPRVIKFASLTRYFRTNCTKIWHCAVDGDEDLGRKRGMRSGDEAEAAARWTVVEWCVGALLAI